MPDNFGLATRSVTSGRLHRHTYYARVELTKLIASIADTGEDRLPSEDELSERLEVSRATVRSALLSLQKDGVVQRVHGRGTYINRHALKVAANISQDRPFAELLADMGYDATVHSDDIRVDTAPNPVGQVFPWTEGTSVCVIRRVFRASGDPAVFCIDYIPMSILPPDIAERPNGRQSIFDFLRQVAGRQVRYSVADIVPMVPSDEVAVALRIPRDQAVLLLQHTHIDQRDQPVAMTHAYVNDRLLRFSVVRTYTNS